MTIDPATTLTRIAALDAQVRAAGQRRASALKAAQDAALEADRCGAEIADLLSRWKAQPPPPPET